MFDKVLVRVWLVFAILAVAYVLAAYVYRVRGGHLRPVSASALRKSWVALIGLEPAEYGTHMRGDHRDAAIVEQLSSRRLASPACAAGGKHPRLFPEALDVAATIDAHSRVAYIPFDFQVLSWRAWATPREDRRRARGR